MLKDSQKAPYGLFKPFIRMLIQRFVTKNTCTGVVWMKYFDNKEFSINSTASFI